MGTIHKMIEDSLCFHFHECPGNVKLEELTNPASSQIQSLDAEDWLASSMSIAYRFEKGQQDRKTVVYGLKLDLEQWNNAGGRRTKQGPPTATTSY